MTDIIIYTIENTKRNILFIGESSDIKFIKDNIIINKKPYIIEKAVRYFECTLLDVQVREVHGEIWA